MLTLIAQKSYTLAHQNRTIAIASDFRDDGAKSPECLQKGWVSGSEIAAQDSKSLVMLLRTTFNHSAALVITVSCL